MPYQFNQEKMSDILTEVKPLLFLHYKEIAHYQDIPLEPDWEAYQKLEELGVMRIYTARNDTHQLVGYALFFLKANLHYKSSLQAAQDILFIHPEHRGFGAKFLLWCDQQLKADGVQAVYHHVKKEHNFGPLLEKFGYELVDLIYARRLDK
jgi:hypothetical protein